jgi:hypothetical protein
MAMTGRCYCGAIQYEAGGNPAFKGQCHCRECQYVSGGMPNVTLGMPEGDFKYTKGKAKGFRRTDLPNPVTREFCADCGTQILARSPAMPGVVMLKVGTLDDPAKDFGAPQMVIYTCDKQPFHTIPDGVPSFERTPG